MATRILSALVVGSNLLFLSFTAVAQQVSDSQEKVIPELLTNFVPVTDEMLLRPKPENWISFRNGYNLWGYSPLDQVNAHNVSELRLVWSRAMQHGYQEVEPIVYNGVMFLSNVQDIVQLANCVLANTCGD